MQQLRETNFSPDASIVLIGMRGVGKTSLGLIASTTLRRTFIDCDSVFQTVNGTISKYIATNGWDSFRTAETLILKKILYEHPRGAVIACGGGVVEREENRVLLREFREAGAPIVHVTRDKEETLRYLVDETVRPAWGAEIRQVWKRRLPFYEDLSTHVIVSLTASPPPSCPTFAMKHVETGFVRLLRSIFGLASSHIPLLPGVRPPPISGPSSGEYGGYGACESEMGRGVKGPRTSFVSLNFPDLRVVSGETIRRVAGGVDGLELRVDTLVQSAPDTPPNSRGVSPSGRSISRIPARPTHHFVSLCFAHLRRSSPLPIMYTVRTMGKGGAFPDPWNDSVLLEEYLGLVELGFKLGAEYVDLETLLSDQDITRLLSLRGAATQCIVSGHDQDGRYGWKEQHTMDIYLRATRLGADIVRLVHCPKSFKANIELLAFRERVAALESPIPLTTLNLGKTGQLSRYLNPVFTLVTHPLLPTAAAPGQLTFAQHQQALFLSGLILEKTFFVPTSAVAEAFSREAAHLGLPFTFVVEDRVPSYPMEAHFGGAYLGNRSIPLSAVPDGDDVSVVATDSGWIDLIVPASTEPDTYDEPPSSLHHFKHTNVRILALADVITQNLSPINAVGIHTSALLVGLSSKETKEVIEALRVVGAHWVFLFRCEGSTTISTSSLSSMTPFTKSQSNNGADTPPSIPYPQRPVLVTHTLESFASPLLYARRPPTIVISSSGAPPFLTTLFASPTGGAALDLSLERGMLREALVGKGKDGKSPRDGWHLLGPRDVEIEVERQAFRALTGRRLG